jgi:hypothetical protein
MKNFIILIVIVIISFSFCPSSFSAIVFEDHFDGVISGQWVSVEPVQWVEDGWLHTQDDYAHVGRDSSAFVSDGNTSWRDYTLFLKVDPITTGSWEDARIFFRTSNVQAEYFAVIGNYYSLNIRGPSHGGDGPNPNINLMRTNENGDSTSLFLKKPASYISGGPMDFRITLTGPRIQLSIDGNEVIDVIDPEPLLYGGIGIGAVWEAEARFDDVIVDVVPVPGTFLLLSSGLISFRFFWSKRSNK